MSPACEDAKREFEPPTLEVISIPTIDVITVSCGRECDVFGNGNDMESGD